MLSLVTRGRFEKDYLLAQRRGKRLEKLDNIIMLLRAETRLPAKCRPHRLIGDWAGHWECHIEPDWLLIYQVEHENLILVRTGGHADLF